LPSLVAGDGPVQILFVEVGPIGIAEVEFGVSNLPKQEVGDTHFAPGAYQKLGIGHKSSFQPTTDQILVDVFRLQRSGFYGLCQFACSLR